MVCRLSGGQYGGKCISRPWADICCVAQQTSVGKVRWLTELLTNQCPGLTGEAGLAEFFPPRAVNMATASHAASCNRDGCPVNTLHWNKSTPADQSSGFFTRSCRVGDEYLWAWWYMWLAVSSAVHREEDTSMYYVMVQINGIKAAGLNWAPGRNYFN